MTNLKLEMNNEQLIFEIKMFRKEKRDYLKIKYPNLTESKILSKLNKSQKYKFGDKQTKLINEILNDFF